MQALLATPQSLTDDNWYADSGATHHLTADLANLNVRADEDQIMSYMLPKFFKICCLFRNLLLILIPLLNFTLNFLM